MMKLIAKGNTAEVFDYSKDKVCKLFYLGYPVENVNIEFQNARLAYNLKLPVPMCYEQVYIDNRHGLIYEKAQGVDLINYLTDPAMYDKVVMILANTHKKILDNECSELPSYKDFVRRVVADKDMDTLKQLDKLPDGNALCHGDYHPGNIIVDNDGCIKVIDLMNLCRGPREYDIARTYYLIGYSKLPKGMANFEGIQAMRQKLAKDYLHEMAISLSDIAPFLPVIEKCHSFETSSSHA